MHISNDENEGTTWLLSEYIPHLFGMKIVDTFTWRSCEMKKESKVTVDSKLIWYFEEVVHNNENVNIFTTKGTKTWQKSSNSE